MFLYAKQKVFTLRDRFRFFDETEKDVFIVEGKLLSWGKQLTMFDAFGTEVAFIKQKVFSFLPVYYIYMGGREVAVVRQKLSFFRPHFVLDHTGWDVRGDFFNHDYDITVDERLVASVHKRWLSWGDTYEISIVKDEDAALVACIVLCIDCVNAANDAASSSASTSTSN